MFHLKSATNLLLIVQNDVHITFKAAKDTRYFQSVTNSDMYVFLFEFITLGQNSHLSWVVLMWC